MSNLTRLEASSWFAALPAAALTVVAAMADPSAFYPAYLSSYMFWLDLSLGALAVLMIQHLVAGSWGFLSRRVLEAATATLPLLALLLIPLYIGRKILYPWAGPDGGSSRLHAYLNPEALGLRALLYFAIWLGCAAALRRWSRREDAVPDPGTPARCRRLSAAGLVLYGLTLFFASVDWVLSVEQGWSSTIYGLLYVAGQGVSAFAFLILTLVLLSRRGPVSRLLTPARLDDLAKLLQTSILVWVYIAFSQYLIIWSENLPREASWVAHRTASGWKSVAAALLLFHFALPFVLLLFRDIRTRRAPMIAVALLLLGLRFVDDYWRVVPAFQPDGLRWRWSQVAAPVSIGLVWVAVFIGALRRRPLLPQHDAVFPRLAAEGRVDG